MFVLIALLSLMLSACADNCIKVKSEPETNPDWIGSITVERFNPNLRPGGANYPVSFEWTSGTELALDINKRIGLGTEPSYISLKSTEDFSWWFCEDSQGYWDAILRKN